MSADLVELKYSQSVVTKGKIIADTEEQLTKWDGNTRLHCVLPMTAVGNVMNFSTPVNFRISSGQFGRVTKGWLEVTITNEDGADACMPLAAPLLIDRIECSFNGDKNPFITCRGHDLWHSLQFYTPDELDAMMALDGLHIDTANAYISNGFNLTPGESRIFQVPLNYSTLLEAMNPQVHASDILVDVFFRVNPISGGSVTPTLTATRFLFQTFDDNHTEKKIKSLYLQGGIRYQPFVDVCEFRYPATSLTGGLDTDILLSGLHGEVHALAISIRSTLVEASHGLVTYTAMSGSTGYDEEARFDLLDSNCNSVLGITPTARQARFIHPSVALGPHTSHGDFSSQVPLYWIIFTRDGQLKKVLMGDYQGDHRRRGTRFFDGMHSLRLRPLSGTDGNFSDGSYTVTVYAYRSKALALAGGESTRVK